MKNLYQKTDKYLKALKEKIRKEFNYLSIKGFDEINAISTMQTTKDMYNRLKEFNEKEYLTIVIYVIGQVEKELSEAEKKKLEKSYKSKTALAEDILHKALVMYNPVTGYLYDREAERKQMRLSEEIITAKEILDRQRFQKTLKTGANLWFTQSGQYGIDVADVASLEAMRRAGISKIQWVTERDNKVCKECQAKDGEVYSINNAPPKEHYHCRCYYIPYRED